MGPTGTPTEIPNGQTVLLAGGGLLNAVLFSIARALRAAHNKVLYFAGYKQAGDLFRQEDIEAATDQLICSSDSEPSTMAPRPHDPAFFVNNIQSLTSY